MRQILFICAIALGFTSCKKDAGEGGTSVVEGQVYKIFTFDNVVNEFDSLGNVDTTYLVLDTLYYQLDSGKDVFIIYSNDEGLVYDDKFETDWEGRYHFEFLRKGDYTVFTHVDSTVINDVTYDYPVFQHISITSNNSTNTLSDFIIFKSN